MRAELGVCRRASAVHRCRLALALPVLLLALRARRVGLQLREQTAARKTTAERRFFKCLGACRRRTPRGLCRSEGCLRAPPRRDPSWPLGVRRRHAPRRVSSRRFRRLSADPVVAPRRSPSARSKRTSLRSGQADVDSRNTRAYGHRRRARRLAASASVRAGMRATIRAVPRAATSAR